MSAGCFSVFLYNIYVHVSMYPFLQVSMYSCLCLHVPMSPCLHVPMSPCLHFSMFPVFMSMYPCSMSSCLCLHVSMSSCLHVSMSMSLCFRKKGTNEKRETSVCFLQTETENGSFFTLVGKRLTVIDDCCFSNRAHLCI
jgi:hypothetical protein